MQIRKEFRVESAHIVRNCTSERCSHSVHGHSAVVEVIFEGRQLDNAQMLVDFGLMKGSIKQFIDSMDHCYLLCSHDKPEFKEFIKQSCDRYIELPFNPSAEMLSMFIMIGVQRILDATEFNNGEDMSVQVSGVRYHETTTGYAQCDLVDCVNYENVINFDLVEFSEGVKKDWSSELRGAMELGHTIINPIVERQIDL